jgi:hypothetical protein
MLVLCICIHSSRQTYLRYLCCAPKTQVHEQEPQEARARGAEGAIRHCPSFYTRSKAQRALPSRTPRTLHTRTCASAAGAGPAHGHVRANANAANAAKMARHWPTVAWQHPP